MRSDCLAKVVWDENVDSSGEVAGTGVVSPALAALIDAALDTQQLDIVDPYVFAGRPRLPVPGTTVPGPVGTDTIIQDANDRIIIGSGAVIIPRAFKAAEPE